MIAIAFTFLLALIASWALVLPFFQKEEEVALDQSDQRAKESELLQRKEMALQRLEELEQDYLAEKLSDSDYQQSKLELTDEAARCLVELDQINVNQQ